MGKNNLILGTARGKLGDIVFYRTGGEQRFRTRVRPYNPRSTAQVFQRCIMATVVKAYSNFVTVCDHAFQNFSGKAKNQERYMRLNAKMFRENSLYQIQSFNPLQFTKLVSPLNYLDKEATFTVVNPYIIAEGDLPVVNVAFGSGADEKSRPYFKDVTVATETPGTDLTYRQVIEMLGLSPGDQLTFVANKAESKTSPVIERTFIARVILMPANGDLDSPFITTHTSEAEGANINDPNPENYGFILFTTYQIEEGYKNLTFRFEERVANNELIASVGVIVSRFENNMWRRSNTTMLVESKFKSLYGLKNAMQSYLKSDTSSLYLNQASRSRTVARERISAEELRQIEQETGSAISENEDFAEQETSTKSKSRSK